MVVATRGGRARVMVWTTAGAFRPKLEQKIFEKFGTVAAAKKGKSHCAGLGLAFCKLAVEAHGGSIGVEPRQPRGSVFCSSSPAQA